MPGVGSLTSTILETSFRAKPACRKPIQTPKAIRINLPIGTNPWPIRIQKWKPSYRKSRDSRSEEHTSELQSRRDLVCRLLLEKKKKCDTHADSNTSNT